MPSISYQEVDLSSKRLRKLKQELDQAPNNRKIGAYNKWLHYANLKHWRDQGLHFRYLTGSGNGVEPQYYCTCGLIVDGNGTGAIAIEAPKGVALDEVQIYRGHRQLPSAAGLVVAFIVDMKQDWAINKHRWQVLCQECGAYEQGLQPEESALFVTAHNRDCGGM